MINTNHYFEILVDQLNWGVLPPLKYHLSTRIFEARQDGY